MTNAGIADSVNKVSNFVTGWHELKRDTDASAVAGGWLPRAALWTAISRRRRVDDDENLGDAERGSVLSAGSGASSKRLQFADAAVRGSRPR